MVWMTDKSQAILNEWHICCNAISGKRFSAMPVSMNGEIKWIIDPWCRENEEQSYITVTHFMYYPEGPRD